MLFKSKSKHIIEQEKNLNTIDLEEIEYHNKLQDPLNKVPRAYRLSHRRFHFADNQNWHLNEIIPKETQVGQQLCCCHKD